MVFGGSFDENSFQLDGVNVTDNYFNEGFAEPNPDAIEEVEVLSLGAPAEYGNLMGAVYNIVTKQGTNAFHGDASYFYQSDGLSGNNTEDVKLPNGKFFDACADDPTKRCPWTRGNYWEVSAQLGGPIVKDKLWFFASYGRAARQLHGPRRERDAALSAINIQEGTLFPEAQLADQPQPPAGRQLQPRQVAAGPGISFNEAPSTAWTRTRTVPTLGLSYTGTLSSKTTLDVRYSGFYGNVTRLPDRSERAPRPSRASTTSTPASSRAAALLLVRLRPNAHHGDGQGLAPCRRLPGRRPRLPVRRPVQQRRVTGIYGYNDLVFTYTYGGAQYSYGYERQPFTYAGTARNIGAFFDDSFRVNDRLTLNLGLRYDHSKAFSPANEGFDENGKPTGESFARMDHFTWKNFSPRLGLNWKLTADGKTVLKVHAGRYHPQITTGEFTNVLGPSIKPYYCGLDYNFATGTFDELSLFSEQREPARGPELQGPAHRPVPGGLRERAGPERRARSSPTSASGAATSRAGTRPRGPTSRSPSSTTPGRIRPAPPSTSSSSRATPARASSRSPTPTGSSPTSTRSAPPSPSA